MWNCEILYTQLAGFLFWFVSYPAIKLGAIVPQLHVHGYSPSTCSCRVVAEASTKGAQNASYARGEKGEKNEFFFRSSLNATCACLVLASVRLRKAKMFTPVLKATWQPFYRSRWNATVLYGNCITMRDIHFERLCKGFNWIISISYNDGIPQSVC